jgi:urea carboxylase-associated protein 2
MSSEKAEAIAANRRRYEELKAAGQGSAPKALPALSAIPAPDATHVRLTESVPKGWYWTGLIRRGEVLRLVNPAATEGVSALFWSAADPTERYNAADSIKIQWTARLQKGRVLFSDMGRVMASIVEDSSGRHDTLAGGSVPKGVGAGERNSRTNFLLAAAKLGLGPRDVPPCITFFAGLETDEAGKLRWIADCVAKGDWVELRADMDLLVALSNCPHPLAPNAAAAGPVELTVRAGEPADREDFCRTATAEATRGFENLDALLSR